MRCFLSNYFDLFFTFIVVTDSSKSLGRQISQVKPEKVLSVLQLLWIALYLYVFICFVVVIAVFDVLNCASEAFVVCQNYSPPEGYTPNMFNPLLNNHSSTLLFYRSLIRYTCQRTKLQ